MSLVFAGTPDFAVPSLAALIDAGFRPQLVLTQPDRPAGRGQQLQPPPVKLLALERGLDVQQPDRLSSIRERIEALKPDVMVVVAYAHKIPPWLLMLPPLGVLNVHASLLPRYRGASPVAAALLNGDVETGVSIMKLDEGWDTGPVLRQRSLTIRPEDNAGTLTDRLATLGADLLVEVMRLRVKGMITSTRQSERLADYAPKLNKSDGRLDWAQPAEQLARKIRAYTPWPGAFTFWRGKTFKILAAQAGAGDASGPAAPGQVLEGLRIATGSGHLIPLQVQLEGKKAMPAAAFLAGQPSLIGSVLG